MQYDPDVDVQVPAVIASGTDSAEVNLTGKRLVGAFIPASFEGATVSLLVKNPAGTFVPVNNSGALYTVPTTANTYVVFDPIVTLGLREIKIKSATSVAASRTVTLVTREV